MRCTSRTKLLARTLAVLTLSFSATAIARTADDARFEAAANAFIEKLLVREPEAATALGDHRYDARSGDYSLRGVAADRAFYHKTLDQLAAIPGNKLSPDNSVDRSILQNELQKRLFDIEVMNSAALNPLAYAPTEGVYLLIARDFAPLKQRLVAVKSRLEAFPTILAAARQNLTNPPRVFTETAIQRNKGAMALVGGELDDILKTEPEMRARLEPARKRALAALTEYGEWLQHDLLPRSNGDFRIGKDNYRQKLRLELDSDLSPEDILKSAETELAATQAAMLETGLPLYRRYYPDRATDGIERRVIIRAVLDKIAETHPDNATIVDDAKRTLALATAFVREHNLVTVPDAPVQVIVMPEFQRGAAVAFCNPAGALEKNGATFFAISPTPADWTPQRVASFFREYNSSMLNELTVHEAMPGHYLQLSVANRAKAPTRIRALFYSGTFVEGWATYAEQFMADAGFGGPETRMQELKMRLRLIINAIIDQKIQAGNMSEQEAMDLMKTDGFQEDGEAAGKWKRAQLTSTQLPTYFVGNLEINALARDLKAKTGADMKTVHDRMLEHGSISTKYVRQLLGL
jgi:uncharacterized protein (DUF885 family)